MNLKKMLQWLLHLTQLSKLAYSTCKQRDAGSTFVRGKHFIYPTQNNTFLLNSGATVGAEANIFGQKVSTEVSASASVETSLTIGYSESSSVEISESFETEVTVPAGKKVLLNLFKEKYDLSVSKLIHFLC